MAALVQQIDPSAFTVAPLSPTIGAELSGFDLRQKPSPALARDIWAAMLRYKVVFFRDQFIDNLQHIAMAEALGTIEPYYTNAHPDFPVISAFEAKYAAANLWHTDGTWRPVPPRAAILRGVTLPAVGGDTIWCDGEAAYASLPEAVKQEIDELYAIHDPSGVGRTEFDNTERTAQTRARAREVRRQNPAICHPIVRTHPETGRLVLFLNPALVTGIMGMDWGSGRALLDRLHAHYIQPQHCVRFRWRPGSIAMWDERCTLHYAVKDFGDFPRRVERILLAGTEIPYR